MKSWYDPVQHQQLVFSSSGGVENMPADLGGYFPSTGWGKSYGAHREFLNAPPSGSPFTLMGFNIAALDNDHIICMGPTTVDNNSVQLLLFNGRQFLRLAHGGATVFNVNITAYIAGSNNNRAAHVAVSFDGTNAYLYANGVLVGGPTALTYTKTSSTCYFHMREADRAFGGDLHGKCWDGRIYNRCLTPAEIRQIAWAPHAVWTSTDIRDIRRRVKSAAAAGGSLVGDGLTRSALLNRRRLAA